MKHDGEVVCSSWVSAGMGSSMLGCLGAFAIIPLVVVGVNLVVGEENLPREIEGTTPWFLGVGILFGGLAIGFFLKKRERAELVRTSAGLILRVGGVDLATTPVTIAYGYERRPLARGLSTTILLLHVAKDGQVIVTFKEEWGELHGVPEGWPARWPAAASPHYVYSVLHGKLVCDLVRELGARSGTAP